MLLPVQIINPEQMDFLTDSDGTVLGNWSTRFEAFGLSYYHTKNKYHPLAKSEQKYFPVGDVYIGKGAFKAKVAASCLFNNTKYQCITNNICIQHQSQAELAELHTRMKEYAECMAYTLNGIVAWEEDCYVSWNDDLMLKTHVLIPISTIEANFKTANQWLSYLEKTNFELEAYLKKGKALIKLISNDLKIDESILTSEFFQKTPILDTVNKILSNEAIKRNSIQIMVKEETSRHIDCAVSGKTKVTRAVVNCGHYKNRNHLRLYHFHGVKDSNPSIWKKDLISSIRIAILY